MMKNQEKRNFFGGILYLIFIHFSKSDGSNCIFSSFNGRCFKVISKPSAFNSVYEARQMCLNDGWDLVGISSEQENSFIIELISNYTNHQDPPSKVYIGLSDVDEAGNFTWMNGLPVSYKNYSDSQINFYFYGVDRRCFAISSPSRTWQQTSPDMEWSIVPCCFPYQGIRYAVCSDYKIGSKNYNSLQAYCIGNCSSDWYKYEDSCYLLSQSFLGSSNATYSRRDCVNKNADLISYSTKNSLFVNFLVSSIASFKNVSLLHFYLGFWKSKRPPNFDGTDISPNLPTASGVLYQDSDQARNCLVFWYKSEKSEEPCCVNLPVGWLACQKPETLPVSVDLDSDVLAKECYGTIDDCLSQPCQNGGTCQDHVQYYKCICPPGYQGNNCEITVNPCMPSPCENNGSCTVKSSADQYSCSCPQGYNGTNCEIFWNHCICNPCQNNGTCTAQKLSGNTYGYSCQCLPGTTGVNCETDTINECSSNPCKMSSTCVNQINEFRCDCVPGNTGVLCDEVVACTNLTSLVKNSKELEVTGNGVSYGDLRRFECLGGFQFSDMTALKAVICAADNQWNDSIVIYGCEESCAFLPVVHNATVFNASTRVNSSTTFECVTGHAINSNITQITFTCLQDLNWSPPTTLLTCQPRRCPTLASYPNQYHDHTEEIYGTTVKVWCDIGYQFFDNTTARTLRCKANGDWTAALPPCDPVRCPDLPLYPHMSRNTSSSTYLTYASYTCDPSYRMLDGSQYKVIMCDAAGLWSDDVTDCTKDRCFPLPYVANATPSTTDANFWTQSTLTCIPGHKFKTSIAEFSNAIMTCQENSWWSPILTACEPIFCPELSINGKNLTRDTESRLYGTVVKFSCLEGHYIDASIFLNTMSISCQDTQEWNDTNIPTCKPIQCSDPPIVSPNGVRSPLTSTLHFYPEIVSYSCNQGTKFIDGQKSKNIFCNDVGVWNETDVSCKSERCEPVIKMPNSYPDTTNTSWYVTVTYHCNKGYYRTDGLPYYAIKCEAGGVWNDTYDATKDCKIKSCPPVETFPNCDVNSTSVTFYGTTIQYKCNIGHKYLEDNSTIKYRRCNEDALWIPRNFSGCEIIYCPILSNVNNTTKSSNETHYNTNINFTCLPGFQFPDRSKLQTITCTENETWTSIPSPCDVIFCPPLPSWSDTVFNTTDNNFDSSVEYHCKEGTAFKSHKDEPGNNTILHSRCIATRQWVPPIETCFSLTAINADIKGKSWESPNAASLGTVACAILGVVLAIVLFMDLRKILLDFNMMRNNIKTFILTEKANKVKPEN